jgi:hypothetical protein
MSKQDKFTIPYYDFEPFCLLEGQSSLEDCEYYFHKSLNYYRIRSWVLDDLYKKPERVAAIQFLKPKTIVLGTTGVYRDKLDALIDLFFSLKIEGLKNVILTLDTERELWDEIKTLKSKIPNVKIFNLWSCPSMFDKEGEKYEIYEIEL